MHDKSSDDLRVNGSAYDTNGQIVANWNDRASCIDPTKQTLYYAWEGHWPRNPNESREGFGQIRFDESKTDFSSGKGVFFDRNLSDVRSITMKTREWQRCTTEEIEDMKRKDSKIKGKLVRNKLIGKPRRNGENTFQLLKLRGLSSPKWSEIAVHDT